MNIDYFQEALHTFNGGNWYGWKTHDDNGDKIPNKDRMQYKYIKVIKDGAVIPSKSDVDTKVTELEKAEEDKVANHTTNKTSGKAKLKTGEALSDAEVEALFG
tara:strand:+ start:470 stop:778 length:309 start_codon:yes stop_codon:yes gene_type:complete